MRLSSDVRTVVTPDGAVVLDVRHGQMFRANPTGSKILELVKEGLRESQIVEEICRISGVSAAIALSDVREFLASMEQYQLVESGVPPCSPEGVTK